MVGDVAIDQHHIAGLSTQGGDMNAIKKTIMNSKYFRTKKKPALPLTSPVNFPQSVASKQAKMYAAMGWFKDVFRNRPLVLSKADLANQLRPMETKRKSSSLKVRPRPS